MCESSGAHCACVGPPKMLLLLTGSRYSIICSLNLGLGVNNDKRHIKDLMSRDWWEASWVRYPWNLSWLYPLAWISYVCFERSAGKGKMCSLQFVKRIEWSWRFQNLHVRVEALATSFISWNHCQPIINHQSLIPSIK